MRAEVSGMQVDTNALPLHVTEALKPLVRNCHSACVKAHQHDVDVNVATLIEASVDKLQTSFEGSPADWQKLLYKCALPQRSNACARSS